MKFFGYVFLAIGVAFIVMTLITLGNCNLAPSCVVYYNGISVHEGTLAWCGIGSGFMGMGLLVIKNIADEMDRKERYRRADAMARREQASR